MKTSMIILSAFSMVACGGGQKSSVMTPEDRLNAQLAMAEEQKGEDADNTGRFSQAETVDEEESKFDDESANHEMRRAALNATDCPNTFEKSQLGEYTPGKTSVALTFENNGGVKDVNVNSPYDGTPVGDCIIRAMGTVHVEPFKGPEVQKTWDLELGPAKPPETKKRD